MSLDTEDLDRTLRNKIDDMTQFELCKLYRFAPSGHWTNQGEIGTYFVQSFKLKGGMTPEISKKLGWARPAEYHRNRY